MKLATRDYNDGKISNRQFIDLVNSIDDKYKDKVAPEYAVELVTQLVDANHKPELEEGSSYFTIKRETITQYRITYAKVTPALDDESLEQLISDTIHYNPQAVDDHHILGIINDHYRS